MRTPDISYDDFDKSNQRLPFGDEYFPAYFRLLKWKLLDVCVSSVNGMSVDGIGLFALFKSCIPEKKLIETVQNIVMEAPSLADDPDFKQVRDSGIDGKAKKQADTFLKLRHDHLLKVQRRRHAEYFLKKVLFSEEGLKIADRLMYEHCPQVYGTAHWEKLPLDWNTATTYKEKFYDKKELKKDPYGMQRLDRIAGSARGMIIMKRLHSNPLCAVERNTLLKEVRDKENLVHTDLVREMLDEGPIYELTKGNDGEELRIEAEKWTVHKTLIMFLTIPGFNSNIRSEKQEQDEWFYGLLEAMRHDPVNRSALFFLNENYAEELDERDKERDRIRLQILKGQQVNEEAVGEQLFQEIRPQPADSGYNPSTEVTELVLRTYQEELVQAALEGKNCVIVAPTGSGKTEVAIYAALEHINERHSRGKAARVALLVPKIPLVSQQKERFLKYCGGKYHVNGFHGSEKSDSGEGRRDDVLLAHIVVMTPQILINMLQSVRRNERLYVSDFSMMIFDEVHKTTGNHPYVLINRLIQDWEYEKPQIIGLTASLNVSASAHTEMTAMLGNIYEMLALLNAPHLSTITHQASIDELNMHVGKPDDSVEVCQAGKNILRDYICNYLTTSHTRLIAELDRLAKSRHNCFPANTFRVFKKTKPDNYEYYDSLLQNILQDLNKLNTPEKMCAQKWLKYIKVYVEARGIVDLMPAMVAFNYMEKAITNLDSGHTLSQFSDFMSDKVYDSLRREAEGVEPPIVLKLNEKLMNQFEEQPESRVIIFVTQRSTAQRVCEFLNESEIWNRFEKRGRKQAMVGYVLGTNKTGAVQQNQSEQQMILDQFNNGQLKVIVATSVVEEGLDVTACNLIIKYNCSSGSAIQLVQQRGRARAKNSRSVLLTVHSKINEAENSALISEKYMRQCVKYIEQNGPKQLASEVSSAVKRIEAARQRKLTEEMINRSKNENKIYKLTCTSCSRFICKSPEIKKVFSNYMVFDPSAWSNFSVESRKIKYVSEETQPLSTIKCSNKDCGAPLGKAYKMRGVYLPQLEVRTVTFVPDNHDGSTATQTKWSSVENELFFIGEATQNDFEIMLNAMADTEANMDKKRMLDLDSKQYIRDIELKKYRLLSEKKEKEAQERAEKAVNLEGSSRPRTDFSEDED